MRGLKPKTTRQTLGPLGPALTLIELLVCSLLALLRAAAPLHMTLPQDLQVQLVAGEPMIVQPVCIEFDDRGRLWVMQYIQYPNPAGLKRAVVDRWSRTTYESIPEPPPRGPKGEIGRAHV